MPQPAVQHGQPKYWVKNLLLYESDRIAVSLLLQQARQWHHPFCCLHAAEWGYRPATKGLELTIFASQLVFAPMLPLKDEEQVVQMHHNGVFHWVVSHRRASDSTALIYYRLGTDHFWFQAYKFQRQWQLPLQSWTHLKVEKRNMNKKGACYMHCKAGGHAEETFWIPAMINILHWIQCCLPTGQRLMTQQDSHGEKLRLARQVEHLKTSRSTDKLTKTKV